MHILKLKSSKFYVKIIGSMQILGTTPLNLQENIKAFKEIGMLVTRIQLGEAPSIMQQLCLSFLFEGTY